MRTTLLATVAALLIAGPAFAFDDQAQGQQQGQIATGGKGGNATSRATGGSARSNSAAGAVAGSISISRSGASSDNSNPQTTTQEGDHYDGSFGFGYADAPMPSSPVVSPSAVNLPQHTETYKILGPIFGHSYTGGAACTNSGAVAVALLYRDAWLLTVQHYGVAAAAPAQAEYAKTLEAAGKACSD